MTIESVRTFCRSLPDVTEDIKWGQDLVFSIGKKMFCAMNTEPPHQISFKTTADDFAELIERPGIRPAPYLARAMWVQEEALGETLDRGELERLLRQAYELVRAKLPKRKASAEKTRKGAKASAARRSRAVPAPARRRRR
jgi:predicted DNA-binding protein (MmcQ/YjbR family)